MVGWLKYDAETETIHIPNFTRHNGESAKKRALNTERQARWRNAHVDASVTQAALPEKRREEYIKDKKNARVNGALALPDWLPKESWSAWLEVRAKVKAPNTDRALRLALRDLDKLRGMGQDPNAVLEQATTRGWRGLFAVKEGDMQNVQVKKAPPNLCAYCQSPNVTGSCNGYRHCQEHADDALYGKKPGFMPGVVAKPVSGS